MNWKTGCGKLHPVFLMEFISDCENIPNKRINYTVYIFGFF